ncbi:glycosyltransferase family 4 protein [Desertibacillus haloalkaliphilus]|uniref:glycosyltransferase family 4 protein n=1 Tax=Desertibacillus haloalkaliphilus TaxID=1328930 RepID=UPI001C278055|nr:glycosyltransferase family 4 protein [Desertibacillus haloalkaliphilus]MBU8906550.1 glycosyltransferase family 4 protein [Desertibacillus haloalkaliphilus]
MNKPKILYLSDTNITKAGGAQQSMKVLMEGLVSEYDIYIVTPSGRKFSEYHISLDKYHKFVLRRKNFYKVLLMIKDILNVVRKINPQIIHVQMPATMVIINFLLSVGAIDKKTKIVYTDRGVYGKYGKITNLSINSIVQKAEKIVTTTSVNKLNYANQFPKYRRYEEKFKVIYNTAGKEYDYYDITKRDEIKEKYKIDSNDFVIGLCGRYSEQKNWPLAYEILEKCKSKIDKLRFLIILGTDNSKANNAEAKEYIRKVKELVGEKKINAFINLNNNEVADLYYAMDCFLLTSKWESFGRTAVEAMARKNVVIGTNVDGLAEVIGNKNYIFDTAEEAFEIIEKLFINEEELQSHKEKFYDRYHEKFGYNRNIEMHRSLYKSLLE